MDNLTHSVVGLGIGALIDRSLPAEPTPERRRIRSRMLLIIGCLASNFPDLDLVLTPLLDAPLGYLLHHRGHTHTLVAALSKPPCCWPWSGCCGRRRGACSRQRHRAPRRRCLLPSPACCCTSAWTA
jgi:membrane-bound metal-dependent hydrolase YbcI (DUF457 family)